MSKRFTYVKNNSITQYQSLPIQEIGKSKALHCQGVVDKLNKLSEENEQLEIEIADLKYENKNLKINLNACKRGRKQLVEENEQLKFQLDECQNHKLYSRRELEKENEQLKKQLQSEHQMLQNAILLERTRMGKNSLKQYKEAIQ